MTPTRPMDVDKAIQEGRSVAQQLLSAAEQLNQLMDSWEDHHERRSADDT